MHVQGTEARPEGLVLVDVEFLVPEKQDLVRQQRYLHLGERGIVEPGELHAVHFGADHGGEGLNVHGFRL